MSRYIKTARRSFPKPEDGALYSLDDVALVADVPPIVVVQAAASGALRTVRLDGVDLVEGSDLCTWVVALDDRVATARPAA